MQKDDTAVRLLRPTDAGIGNDTASMERHDVRRRTAHPFQAVRDLFCGRPVEGE
jgi:hypothetical protein